MGSAEKAERHMFPTLPKVGSLEHWYQQKIATGSTSKINPI